MAGRNVLITGAGSGLGLALAQRHAARGDVVACVDVHGERAEAARASLPGSGHVAFTADVGSDASMQALRDAVLAQWGVPDVLINNAGIASRRHAARIDDGRMARSAGDQPARRRARLPGRSCPACWRAARGASSTSPRSRRSRARPSIMSYGVAKGGVVHAVGPVARGAAWQRGVGVGRVSVLFPDQPVAELAWQRAHERTCREDDDAQRRHDRRRRRQHLRGVRARGVPDPADQGAAARWRLRRWAPSAVFPAADGARRGADA